MVLPGIGEPESLILRPVTAARTATREALIRVEASGISFAEQAMRRGKYYDQPGHHAAHRSHFNLAAAALRYTESSSTAGKVVLVP